ncbi:hypothetical protein [Planococcus rifietoensis]|uniref:hypothetical protein n=1 Tax=Planococcus rifietoensis TaxID=200991 RepID=UPI000AFE8578|nr:hypothetical protein [Planococcus rifietoensis]
MSGLLVPVHHTIQTASPVPKRRWGAVFKIEQIDFVPVHHTIQLDPHIVEYEMITIRKK